MMNKEAILLARANLAPISRQAGAEGIVLLKNQAKALPLTKHDNVALFGRCQIDTYRSGTGSGGAVNVPYAVNALEGIRHRGDIEINLPLAATYQNWIEQNPFDNGGGGWAAEPWFQHEMPLTDELVASAVAQSNKAIVFIGRTAGEDQDNADEPGSYRLTDIEMDMLDKVTKQFDCVIVVMNVTNIMDMSWVERYPHIQAVLYSWAAGMEAGHALADVLSGAVSPSGRLSDTIAHQLSDYPSSPNFGRRDRNCYVEDIYVGYRYFETFCPEAVMYEFGFGLSYTQFKHQLLGYQQRGDGAQAELEFMIKVTNIGEQYSAKEVVQLYVQAPQGELGKPLKTLISFAKTATLPPQQSQTIRLIVKVADLASYDDSGVTGAKNCYVVEPGHYQFHLGSSVRNTQLLGFNYEQEQLLVVEQCQEALAPIYSFQRMKPMPCANGRFELGYEPVPLRTVCLAERINSQLPATLPLTGDIGIKLRDVQCGKATMEAFVAQMTPTQLATIVRGEGMCSPKVTPGTASAFGGVSNSLFELGIPVAAAADGPSGIRMDSGHKASQVPIGTLLGCTWNVELNRCLFELVGHEMRANAIDTLLGPGINIHRHPLNGRNFEYFSEDPILTGTLAAAQTLGLSDAGVSGTIKHFAANDQETARVDADSVMSERALREVHVKPFEMAVKLGNATSIMTCYNPVNGHWGASNYDLNTTLLRHEWGYTGIVMTDWWAKMNHPIEAGEESKAFTSYMIRAQNDLYMVVEHDGAERNASDDDIEQALAAGELTLGELQRSAINICRFILNAPVMQRELKPYEPIKRVAPATDFSADAFHAIEQPLVVERHTDCEFILSVSTPGCYQFSAEMSYERDAQAQSSCSLSLNEQFCMSLAINGTQGRTVKVEGLPVRLEAGMYQLDINFVKAGATLSTLAFIPVEQPITVD